MLSGIPEFRDDYPHLPRFKVWGGTWLSRKYGCQGKYKRTICIYGVGDLHYMDFDKRKELFANKMYLDYHPLLLDCLEEYYYNRTRDEARGKVHFRVEEYQKYDLVWNHNPS